MADQHLNLAAFMAEHQLPPAFAEDVQAAFQPLANWVEGRLRERTRGPLLLGLHGGQGTGKSTLADFLAGELAAAHGRRCVVLSIDDLYLTRAQRQRLARDIHPLLATRGVPGTHDLALGNRVLDDLQQGRPTAVPRFDKARDDRAPEEAWPRVDGPVDLVLFEGWCVGVPPQPPEALMAPVNALEADEDAEGVWRQHVNHALAGPYQALFARLDALVLLAAPGMEAVLRWRREQEARLRAATPDGSALMSAEAVGRFVQHYERLTRHALAVLPGRANVVIRLGDNHRVVAVDGLQGPAATT